MSRFRRLSALSLIYEQLEKCEELELIWEAAVMDNTLDDISSLKFLQAIGLKLDKSLSGSRIDDRETSIKVMQKNIRGLPPSPPSSPSSQPTTSTRGRRTGSATAACSTVTCGTAGRRSAPSSPPSRSAPGSSPASPCAPSQRTIFSRWISRSLGTRTAASGNRIWKKENGVVLWD